MKIYISEDSRKIIRKNYNKLINYKELGIIDVVSMMKNMKYQDNIYSTFILNEEIKRKFINFYESKRFKNILYLIKKIDDDFLKNLKEFLKTNNIFFTDYIVIDFTGKIDSNLYRDFDYFI